MAIGDVYQFFADMDNPLADVHIRENKKKEYSCDFFAAVNFDHRTMTSDKSRYFIVWIDDESEFTFISHEDILQINIYDGDRDCDDI